VGSVLGNMQLLGIAQLCIYVFMIYFLLSVNITNKYRKRMNDYLFLVLIVVSIVSLKNAYIDHFYAVVLGITILLSCLWYFLRHVKNDHLALHTPLSYLSFYFVILILVIISGGSLSLLFPEVFILAVLFVITNTGRKISFGVAVMGATTISLLYLNNAVSPVMIIRVSITIALMIAIPQIYGFMYRKKTEVARRQWMNAEEGS
jgi:hypothetical protein